MRIIIDTNVILAANCAHPDLSDKCIEACIDSLTEIKRCGTVLVDEGYLILKEYSNKTSANQQKGIGDVFLKWLLQNQANDKKVSFMRLEYSGNDWFESFPDHQLQEVFDPPDRKFIALAWADNGRAPVLQAADCKWLDWVSQLKDHGISINFLCPEDVCRFYKNKFPEKESPELPAS